MTVNVLFLAAGGLSVFLSQKRCRSIVLLCWVLIAVCVVPFRPLWGEVTLSTGVVVIAAAYVLLSDGRNWGMLARFVPFAVVSLFMLALGAWPLMANATSRLSELGVGACAWLLGQWASQEVVLDRRGRETVCWTVFGLVSLQAAVSVLQAAGFEIFVATDEIVEITAGRTAGTLSHPGNLGKIVFLLLVLVLSLAQSVGRRGFWIVLATLTVAFIPVGLSESRANFAALAVLAVGWLVMGSHRLRASGRLLALASVGLFGASFLAPILARSEADPDGGFRRQLLDVATQHIGENFWTGVGPGQYIAYFGQYDAVTASGWPVHNVFVLQLAELGLVGALALLVPLLLEPMTRALSMLRGEGLAGATARVQVCAIPGLIAIGVTGWSLTTGFVGTALFLVEGVLAGLMRRPPPSVVRVDKGSPLKTDGVRVEDGSGQG
jgi:O-antigen ligase